MTDAFLPPIDVSPAPDPTGSLAQTILDKVSDSRTTTARGTVIAIGANGTVTFSVGSYSTPRQGTYLGPTVPQVGEVIIYLNEGSGWPLVLGASGPRNLSIDATKAFIVGNTRVDTAGLTVGTTQVAAGGLTVGGVNYTPTVWTQATLLNGWLVFGGGYGSVAYRKVGDVVQMRGVAKSGTIGNPSPSMLTLPTGFRPPASLMFAVIAGNVLGRINVNTDGNCYCEIGTNTFVSFDGIWFSTIS